MPNTSESDEYDPRFDMVLEEIFHAVRAPDQSGPHIDEFELTDFTFDRLTASEADRVRRHVEVCPTCTKALQETQEIKNLLDVVIARRESRQGHARAVSVFSNRPERRFVGVAFAMASLTLLVVLLTYRASVNHTLRRSRLTQQAQQHTINDLRHQLAQKSADDREKQLAAANSKKQLAAANSKAQRLQAQLNAPKKTPPGPRPQIVAHQPDNGRVTPPGIDHTHVDRTAQNVPDKEQASPLDRAVQVALAENRLPLSKQYQGDMIGSGATEMGSGGPKGTFDVISPVGTDLLTDQPTFVWTPADGASGYEVIVQDDAHQVVADSHILPGAETTRWRSTVHLRRGRTYHWSVTAQTGTEKLPVAPDVLHNPIAFFNVVDSARAEAIEHQAAAVADSPKALAVLYAQQNLLDDAEREAQAWQMTNPSSETARRWLANLRTYRHETPASGQGQNE